MGLVTFDRKMLDAYLENDVILQMLHEGGNRFGEGSAFKSEKWLFDSPAKRMIYFYMYGDLLRETGTMKRILDVGGGYCRLTTRLLANHEYSLIDIMVHDDHSRLLDIEKKLEKEFWMNSDWLGLDDKNTYDIVIANDIFPNVDQRVSLFLDKFLPVCHEMRISFTCYNTPTYYTVKRIDAEEILQIEAWNGARLQQVLQPYLESVGTADLSPLLARDESIFSNRRQVVHAILKGRLK